MQEDERNVNHCRSRDEKFEERDNLSRASIFPRQSRLGAKSVPDFHQQTREHVLSIFDRIFMRETLHLRLLE